MVTGRSRLGGGVTVGEEGETAARDSHHCWRQRVVNVGAGATIDRHKPRNNTYNGLLNGSLRIRVRQVPRNRGRLLRYGLPRVCVGCVNLLEERIRSKGGSQIEE